MITEKNSMSSWLRNFESIGNNCEFGFVQRALGFEESSLLRWAFVDDITALRMAILSQFRGIFAFENLRPAGDGTMVMDVKFRIAFHSKMSSQTKDGEWIFALPEKERKEIFEEERQKVRHLIGKFERNIAGSERIYVLKYNNDLTDDDASRVFEAIAARGGGRLLYVMETRQAALAGTVERIHPRMMKGWIDRLAPYSQSNDVSLSCWEAILRGAARGFAEAMPSASDRRPPLLGNFWRNITFFRERTLPDLRPAKVSSDPADVAQ